MLYHVRMDVHVPHDMDADRFELLKAQEKARAQELQRQGKWRHLWRSLGDYIPGLCREACYRYPVVRRGRPGRLT